VQRYGVDFTIQLTCISAPVAIDLLAQNQMISCPLNLNTAPANYHLEQPKSFKLRAVIKLIAKDSDQT